MPSYDEPHADPFATDPFPTAPDADPLWRRLATARPTDRSVPVEMANHPDFELIKELGRGGMGVVYLVRNRLMDRLEVLKVVNNVLLDWHDSLERFQREIRAAASLSHANIVAAHSALRLGDLLVFAMEYVDGQDLWQVVRRRGRLPVTNATFYVHQAAIGLQHAHERGMVHRDIKPHNLMLSVVGKKHIVKILDFGLAKATREKPVDGELTGSGQMLGTPHYIAPEQSLDAHQADIRADIYSLGCTLYFLLSGDAPFAGNSSLYEIMHAHDKLEARPLDQLRADVPAELAAMVAKMMAKKPADRYQTPAEVARALGPFFKAGAKAVLPRPVAGAQESSQAESWPDLSFDLAPSSSSRIRAKALGSKRASKSNWAPMAAGMIALAICSAAGFFLWSYAPEQVAQAPATIVATRGTRPPPVPGAFLGIHSEHLPATSATVAPDESSPPPEAPSVAAAHATPPVVPVPLEADKPNDSIDPGSPLPSATQPASEPKASQIATSPSTEIDVAGADQLFASTASSPLKPDASATSKAAGRTVSESVVLPNFEAPDSLDSQQPAILGFPGAPTAHSLAPDWQTRIPALQVRQGCADFPDTAGGKQASQALEQFEYRVARGKLFVPSSGQRYEFGDLIDRKRSALGRRSTSPAGNGPGKSLGLRELAAAMNVKDIRVELKQGPPWRWQVRVTRFTDVAQKDAKVAEKLASIRFITSQRAKARSAFGTKEGHEALEKLAEVLEERPAPPMPDVPAPPELMRHHQEMELWVQQLQIAADRRLHELLSETAKLKKAAQADYDARVNQALGDIEYLSATLYRVAGGVRAEDIVILDP